MLFSMYNRASQKVCEERQARRRLRWEVAQLDNYNGRQLDESNVSRPHNTSECTHTIHKPAFIPFRMIKNKTRRTHYYSCSLKTALYLNKLRLPQPHHNSLAFSVTCFQGSCFFPAHNLISNKLLQSFYWVSRLISKLCFSRRLLAVDACPKLPITTHLTSLSPASRVRASSPHTIRFQTSYCRVFIGSLD